MHSGCDVDSVVHKGQMKKCFIGSEIYYISKEHDTDMSCITMTMGAFLYCGQEENR